MKTSMKLVSYTLILTLMLITLSESVLATNSQKWSWQWSWNESGNKNISNMIDTNSNWIADWKEDWDNDWILNKDDEDFEKKQEKTSKQLKQSVNKSIKSKNYKKYLWSFTDTNADWIADWIEDWDNDWILNKDDEDFEKQYKNKAISIDSNNNWISDWEEDWDMDGVINKDDEDFERKYLKKWLEDANKTFSDKRNIKNQKAVDYLQARWIIWGYSDWTFWPNNNVNRVEAIKIILEALWEKIDSNMSESFNDVKRWEWYAWYLSTAKRKGIVKWYNDWSFWILNTVKKVELLKILIESFEIDLTWYEVTNLYPDVSTNEWYSKYVQYAKDNNLIDADENGNINLDQGMTRDEFSEVVYRLLQQQENL